MTDATIYDDPHCRFAAAGNGHECTRNTGAPIHKGESCFSEARARMIEEREAQGLPAEPSPSVLRRVADIVRPVLARKAAS